MARTREKRKAGPAESAVTWFDAEEIPRVGTADTAKLRSRQRYYRWVVWACLLGMPVTLIALLSYASRKHIAPPAAPPAANTSPGRQAATAEVNNWLNGQPSPLPNGRLLYWNGYRNIAPVTPAKVNGRTSPTTAAPYKVEIDDFVLEASGVYYDAGVEMAVTASGATPLAGPSLVRLPGPPQLGAASSPWPGLTSSTNISQALTESVNSWAQAYTQGTGDSLRMTVGDPNGSDSYIPLQGVTSASATVNIVAFLPAPAVDEAVAEVTLNLTWKGETTTTTDSSATYPQTTLDVLVERASTADPVVVAWGPAGTGPTLTPYQNGRR